MKNSARSSAETRFDPVIPQSVNEALISWTVKLSSGSAKQEDQAAFIRWRESDPLHEKAWLKLQSIHAKFESVDKQAASFVAGTMDLADKKRSASQQRRKQLKLLGLAVFSIMASSIFVTSYAPGLQDLSYVAAVGKKETVLLSDGTRLVLNTNTKIDIKYTFFKREIVMQHGEIYIDTGDDKESLIGRRAFWVKTRQAGLEAIGTRFAVKQSADTTRLHVAEGIVAIHAANKQPVNAYAHETYTITDAKHLPVKVTALTMDPVGWVDNVLVAKHMRLEDFAAELSSYSHHPIYCDANAKDFKVSGIYQLDPGEPVGPILKVIVRTFPVKLAQQQDDSILIVGQ